MKMTKKELEEIKNNSIKFDRDGTTHLAINYQDWNKIMNELEKNQDEIEVKLEAVQKKLEELESLHRIQVSNGRHYYWNEEDDALASYWQSKADETKKEILTLKKENGINTPNWWE